MTNYNFLIQQLDSFIRKYYLNKIIRGFLWTSGLFLGMWLIFSLLESQFYFNKAVRKLFFIALFGGGALALVIWVFLPLLRYFRLGSVISHDKAAIIIGDHFEQIQDRLLNVLQLRQGLDKEAYASKELIEASIEQKSSSLRLTTFSKAIDLTQNRKHLKWVLPPLLIIAGLFMVAPSLIQDSTQRIIRNNEDFERLMPFDFLVQNEQLQVAQNENFTLDVRTEGEVLPEEVFVYINGLEYPMSRQGTQKHSYQFKNVYKNTSFYLGANGFRSKAYELEVIEQPAIVQFEVKVDAPAYTRLKEESYKNTGDLIIPEGSKVQWIFLTKAADQFMMRMDETQTALNASGENRYAVTKKVNKSQSYQLNVANQVYGLADSVRYNLQVIKDEYPTINLDRFQDSTDTGLNYFTGTVSDDYGVRRFVFHYEIRDEGGTLVREDEVVINENPNSSFPFEYMLDPQEYDLAAGQSLSYYFEVFDNDGVNGSKSTKTELFSHRKPSKEEVKEQIKENSKEALDKMKDRLDKSKDIQERLKKLREKLLQKKEASWQDKKDLEKLLEEQERLEKEMKEAKEKLEKNLEKQKEISQENQEMLKKQEEIQKRLEEMMDEETKELMEKIRELMDKLNKDEMLEMTEEMEMNEEEVEQEMERMMELYKQLDLENRMNEELNKLEKLAEEQEKLSEKTEKEGVDEEKKQKQEDIEKEFEDIKKEMDQIKKENESLENKLPFGDMSEDEKEIEKNLENAGEQMEQNESGKASESQKKASESMKKMAQTMKSGMQSGAAEQQEEDMEVLRQIMENLVTISYAQEDLIDDIASVQENTPKYVSLVQFQNELEDDFRIVEDSLIALSKRNAQIEQFVLEKVADVKFNFKDAKTSLEDRKINQGQGSQQRAMTYLNDLALMLSEAMSNMQQSMSNSMPGNQNCNKPGGAKPNPGGVPKDKISKGQKSLNEQMKGLLKRMKDGEGQVTSEEFAKMSAKQAALRRALKEMEREMQQSGQNAKDLQDIMDQMNKTEKELVNKRLSAEMLRRQEMIETRLLESERAERERGKDKKRESEEGEDKNRQLPPELEEYLRQRRQEIREYRKNNPELSPFYKKMVEDYYQSLQS